MKTEASEYKPGKCNIGSVEIYRRKQLGFICAAITVVVFALFVFFNAQVYWRFILIIPAALSASGFIQANLRFCAGFGFRGVFNLGENPNEVQKITDEKFKAIDKAKAFKLFWFSLGIGIAVALIACAL